MIKNYADEHTDLERMTCMCDHTEVDCFFDPYSQSLHFAYIGGQLVTEMLRDSVIKDLERQYEKACLIELEESKLSAALDRYEAKNYEAL
jgi:hypothetical protein